MMFRKRSHVVSYTARITKNKVARLMRSSLPIFMLLSIFPLAACTQGNDAGEDRASRTNADSMLEKVLVHQLSKLSDEPNSIKVDTIDLLRKKVSLATSGTMGSTVSFTVFEARLHVIEELDLSKCRSEIEKGPNFSLFWICDQLLKAAGGARLNEGRVDLAGEFHRQDNEDGKSYFGFASVGGTEQKYHGRTFEDE